MLKNSLLVSTIALVVQFSDISAFEQCYYPDGSIPTDYVWEACTGAEYSSCCIPSEGDICQDNGLCWFPPTGNLTGNLFRGTCTDRTWTDPACPANICVSGMLKILSLLLIGTSYPKHI